MGKPQHVDTSIVDLLKAGGASAQLIQQLTPTAAKLTKSHLLELWLRNDSTSQASLATHGTGNLKKAPPLTGADVTSIMNAFQEAYNSTPTGQAGPAGFFCGWSCCCCTPCCCCAVAVAKPIASVS